MYQNAQKAQLNKNTSKDPEEKKNPSNIWRGTSLKLSPFSVTYNIYLATNPGHHPELRTDSHCYETKLLNARRWEKF